MSASRVKIMAYHFYFGKYGLLILLNLLFCHVPYGSDGSGFYTDNTMGCFNVLKEATPRVMKALEEIPVAADEPFVICDYGTADGGISLFLIRDIIAFIKKKYGASKPVHVIYEDQPINDFKSLFLRVHGMLPGPPSYMKEFSEVYATASGTGFFEQCFPAGTLHLGLAFTCMHWMYQRPCLFTDSLQHSLCGVAEEGRLFAEQAARDWDLILLHRARELKKGGRMVIVNLAIDEKGQYLGRSNRIKQSMYDRMTHIWKSLVTPEEFSKMTINNYYRNMAECRRPFDDLESEVSKAGLRLVSIEMRVVNCPYHDKWMASGKTAADVDAARAHAAWFIPTTRTWSNSSFRSSLDDSRSDANKDAMVDTLFKRYEDEVATAPQDHGMDFVHSYMTLAKQ